jgi:hypothetical protein
MSGQIGYQSFAYVLSSLLLTASPSTPSGATAQRLWSFKPSTFAPDVYKTYTIEQGSSAGAERFSFGFMNSLGLTFNRTTADLTSDLMGQTLTEQITMTGAPTDIPALPVDPRAPSVYVGSATAAVQAALQALPNIGANNVTVAGTPGTSYTITGAGMLAGVDMSLMTLSGFTGGPPTISITTAAGLTKLTRASSLGVTIPAPYGEHFTLNATDTSFSYLTQNGMDPTLSLVLEHDSAAAAFMTSLRARTTLFLRLVAFGSAVETLIGIPYLNSLVMTVPFRFTESDRSDVDGAWSSTYTLAPIYNTTFVGWMQFDLTNGLASL